MKKYFSPLIKKLRMSIISSEIKEEMRASDWDVLISYSLSIFYKVGSVNKKYRTTYNKEDKAKEDLSTIEKVIKERGYSYTLALELIATIIEELGYPIDDIYELMWDKKLFNEVKRYMIRKGIIQDTLPLVLEKFKSAREFAEKFSKRDLRRMLNAIETGKAQKHILQRYFGDETDAIFEIVKNA